MRLAIAVLALCAAPTVAHAQSVEIRDGELVLGATYPWRVDASYAFQLADVPVWLHAQITPQAEGAGLSIGLRPTLAVIDDYRLIWASRVGPIVYGRDGASGGAELVSELLNVFGAQEVRFALGPRIDFAAAGGDQSAWRLRTTLTLALGLVESIVSVWVAGELGYAFGGEGAGAFRLAGSLVLGVRPGAIR